MFNWCYIFFSLDENENKNNKVNEIIIEQPKMQNININKKID
jgi:hypothetical protein